MNRLEIRRSDFWIYIAIITFLAGIIFCLFGFFSPPRTIGADTPPPPATLQSAPITFDDLLDAIEWVESRGDANAVGDLRWLDTKTPQVEYQAIGAYQLHKIYVDDCNRILRLMGGTGHYTYEDRWDRDKSRFMTNIVTVHYALRVWRNKRFDMIGYLETAARIHNGGSDGHNKGSTKAYWLKVKERLESLK